jgi:DNA repair exonuclease SbcCD ATPase subunit
MKDSILIEKLILTNFKGERNRTISFDPKQTFAYGDNAVGKTRVFDAFTWLLFGKDSEDRMNYNILLVDDNEIVPKVDATVEGIIVRNNAKTTLKRTFKQKWVRPRGQDIEVLEGNETLFWVDGVAVKANEYKTIVNSILSEDIFKLLTSPTYFLSQKWETQRAILQKMTTPISDERIAMLKPEFADLLSQLAGKDIAKFKAEIKAKINDMKKEKDDIPSRIDQTMKLMPETTDFKPLEARLSEIEQSITKAKKNKESGQGIIQERFNQETRLQDSINDIKRQQQSILFQKNKEEQERVDKLNGDLLINQQTKQSLEIKLRTVTNSIETSKQNERLIEQNLTKLKADKDVLRNEYKTVQQTEYVVDSVIVKCPLFGHGCCDPIAIEKHSNNTEQASTNFNNDKIQKLSNINTKGVALKTQIETEEGKLETLKKEVQQLEVDKVALQKDIDKIEGEMKSFVKVEAKQIDVKDVPEIVALQNDIEKIEKQIETIKTLPLPDFSEFDKQIEDLQKERSDIEIQLSKKDDIEKHQNEIDRLQARAKEVVKIISDLEKLEFIARDFNNTKIRHIEEQVNKLFSFVKFKMFDFTFDGNEFETCIAVNEKGVYISSTNNAEKINAGIDIINALSNFYGVTAPIFIDNRESVTRLIESDSQIINLVVSEPDKTLRVE